MPRRQRLTDFPLAVQFLIAASVVFLFSVLGLGFLVYQVARQNEASHFLAETNETIAQLNTMGRDFYRQQISLQEYFERRGELQLANLRERRTFWNQEYKALQKLVSDSDKQLDLLRQVGENYGYWISISDHLIQTSSQGQKLIPEELQQENALFRQTFLLIDSLVGNENKMLLVREAKDKRIADTSLIARAVINLTLLLVFAIVLAKLYFSIARPVSDLSKGIRRYQSGDFKSRVPVSNASEIGYLESNFNEMAEKIETMVADLRKLDELKTDFLSTVSHELRTPLTSIGGYVKLLAAGDAGPVTDTQREFLYIIDTNVVRLTNLINDILDVEKLESGKVQLERSPQQLGSILKECRDTFDVIAKQKGLELRYAVPMELLPIMGDRDRLIQIFMNLISNAIKYTKQGSVEINATQNDYAVTVRVRDTGIGLSADDQEKLFQKFYRTRSGIASGEGGTGLGLVIARGLVEAHGGRITVESEPGKGTTFIVTFPVSQPIVSLQGSVTEVEEPALAPEEGWLRNIWIIDSNFDDARTLREMLERQLPSFRGFKLGVKTFAGVDAMPEIQSFTDSPIGVILDPSAGATAHEVISQIRKKLHQSVPVLLVGSSLDLSSAFAEGASAAISKPVDPARLIGAVKDLITMKSWRILLADRNTDLRILLKRAFEQRGIKIDDVDRGNLVLGRLEQEYYDLALIDSSFPDISGVDLVRIVRRIPRFRNLPVFMMSEATRGSAGLEDPSAWGVNQFVAKYRGIGGIVDSVCQYLEDKKLVEQHH